MQSTAAILAAGCWPLRSVAQSVITPAQQSDDPAEVADFLAKRPGFTCSRRPEWVLASDCPSSVTESTLDLLEATTVQVERVAAALGLPTRAARDRHLAVLFGRLEDYRNFSAEHDGFNDPGALGHYAPHGRRSMLTATSASPSLRAALALLNDDAPSPRNGHRPPRRSVSPQLRASVDEAIAEARRRWMCVTSHEAAHQVLCERQVHPPGAACPAWLSEGLACCFETERMMGDSGPEFDVPMRRERLQRALATDALLPLGVVIGTVGRPSLGAAGALDWYAQCWGLVAWLARAHPRQLGAYIDATWEGRAGATAAERISGFERVLGSLTDLEPAWRAAWQPRADDRPHGTRARRPAARTST